MDNGNGSTQTLAAATAAQVWPGRKGRRVAYSIANTGAAACYVTLSDKESAVAGSGIYLAPGAILTDSNTANYACWQGNVNAVSTAGTTLALWERVNL